MQFLPEQTHTITFKVDKPKNLVYEKLSKSAKINFIEDDVVEIKLAPQFFDPFAPRGIIRVELSSLDNNAATKLNCYVTRTSLNKKFLYLIGLLLAIWTIFSVTFYFSFYTLLTIVFGWITMYIVIRLTQILNLAKLDNYISYVIKKLD